jgi:hypothetical protein
MEKLPFTIDEIKQNFQIQEMFTKNLMENKIELCPITLEEEAFSGFSRTLFKATYYVGYCKSGVFQIPLIKDFFGIYSYHINFESISQVGKKTIEVMKKEKKENKKKIVEMEQTILKLGYEQIWVHRKKGTHTYQLALAKCKKGKKPEDFLKETEYAEIEDGYYLVALKEGMYEVRFKEDEFKKIKDVSQKRDYAEETYKRLKKNQAQLKNQVKNIHFLLEKNKVRSLFLT